MEESCLRTNIWTLKQFLETASYEPKLKLNSEPVVPLYELYSWSWGTNLVKRNVLFSCEMCVYVNVNRLLFFFHFLWLNSITFMFLCIHYLKLKVKCGSCFSLIENALQIISINRQYQLILWSGSVGTHTAVSFLILRVYCNWIRPPGARKRDIVWLSKLMRCKTILIRSTAKSIWCYSAGKSWVQGDDPLRRMEYCCTMACSAAPTPHSFGFFTYCPATSYLSLSP